MQIVVYRYARFPPLVRDLDQQEAFGRIDS
jgi:hypothetical protein